MFIIFSDQGEYICKHWKYLCPGNVGKATGLTVTDVQLSRQAIAFVNITQSVVLIFLEML